MCIRDRRELISNASDAIDKLYYKSLTDPSVGMNKGDFRILLTRDKDSRTLTVSDNGIGMTKEFMGEMYSAFARAVDTRVNRVRGSGLGLAIVKKIVDLMDGTIEVESKVGKGTTFRVTFTLPTAEEGSVHRDEVQEPVRLPARGVNVLVAEDNALNYEIVVEQLSSYGLHCRRAKDGRDCVRQFERSQPGEIDVILMDMQMPVMEGIEATKKIRNGVREDNDVPIFAMTANTFATDRKRCADAGIFRNR